MNAFTRWFIYNGMRGGIKDDNMRSQVVTLHIDKTPFKNALKIDTEETVFTYVLDENGVILESIKGEWTEEKWALATAALDKEKMSQLTRKVISWFDSHALEVDECAEEKVDWFRALPFILMHLTPLLIYISVVFPGQL